VKPIERFGVDVQVVSVVIDLNGRQLAKHSWIALTQLLENLNYGNDQ
jgi:hypothetical protein